MRSDSPCSCSSRSGRPIFNGLLGEHDPHADVHLRDRRGEPHLPLRLRRDDLARADRADGHLGLPAREHGHTGRRGRPEQGLDAGVGSDSRARPRARDHDDDRRGLRPRRRAQLRHLLPDADADVRRDRELLLRPGDAVRRVLADRRRRRVHARIRRRDRRPSEQALLHRVRGRARGLRCDPVSRSERRSGSRCRASGTTRSA